MASELPPLRNLPLVSTMHVGLIDAVVIAADVELISLILSKLQRVDVHVDALIRGRLLGILREQIEVEARVVELSVVPLADL